MKPFIATLNRSGPYGYWRQITAIIVQESHSTALGEALMAYPNSSANEWTIDEIDCSSRSIIEVSDHESN